MTIDGNFLHDATHIGQKSHVKHAIHFVEDEDVYVAEMQCALLQMIEQTSWCRSHHIDSVFQIFTLFAVADAAVDDGYFDIGESAIIAEGGFNLGRQFARWFEDQTAKFPVSP